MYIIKSKFDSGLSMALAKLSNLLPAGSLKSIIQIKLCTNMVGKDRHLIITRETKSNGKLRTTLDELFCLSKSFNHKTHKLSFVVCFFLVLRDAG